jgi:biotin carboxyl carrier protein
LIFYLSLESVEAQITVNLLMSCVYHILSALRLMVNSKTCLIEQESDPTQLRSPSPGKLVRFLVESGDHVKAGQAYAEIEV